MGLILVEFRGECIPPFYGIQTESLNQQMSSTAVERDMGSKVKTWAIPISNENFNGFIIFTLSKLGSC